MTKLPPKPPGGLPPRPGPQRPKPPGGLPPRSPSGSPASRYQHLLIDGERFFAAKDYETAFSIYSQALKEAPIGDGRAVTELCRCYRKKARKAFQAEDFASAVSLLTEMLDLPQMHPKALDYKVLGESWLELGELAKARQALEQAVALKPELAVETRRLFQRLKTEELSQQMEGLH
ncbi:MAG: hypothetical protein ACAI44_04405 [Candidatus Sericytochromatia bacterium]